MNNLHNAIEELKKHRFYGEIFVTEIYRKALRQQDTVVDLGATFGVFSLYIYPQAKVIYSIEASFDNYTQIRYYIEKYKLDKIKPYHLAIGGKNETRWLAGEPKKGGCTIVGVKKENAIEEVDTKTLNTFLKDNHIDYVDILKFDIEGAEREMVLADDFHEAAGKIDFMIGEIHSGSDEIAEILRKYNFECQISEHHMLVAKKK